MGFFDPITDIFTGDDVKKEAKRNAEAEEAELLRQFEITEQNLQPSLEAAQRQLPGIQQQLTTGGFEDILNQLDPELAQFLQPTIQARGQAGADQLRLAGLDPTGAQVSDLSQIDPTTRANLLLGAEADLFGNRLALSGLGQGAGTTLAELGQRTGAGISGLQAQERILSNQATQQGRGNAISAAALAASFSDERLKDNIRELGKYKGLRIISWDWKAMVPDSWKDITIGFSAQDVLDIYPQFVVEKNGFFAIQRTELLEHLEAI